MVGDRIVVVGGQADGRLVKTTEVFDGKRWSDGADIPTPREHLAAASDGQFVYVVGGRALSPDKNTAALERYDPARRPLAATARHADSAWRTRRPRSSPAICSQSAARPRRA